ncbi:hypothetical protein [Thetidibacter halocola]|uniref:Uncharacterized protein n=1 Tax=Thetidibacter halocola TaxID=2827239 RepID=A0A8J7WH29_9RHOB|nr:hypothetical protein [Thetidibacter halocola]MBS0125201.1 hypothetical protein [Thetidibacter halocola]
MDVILHVGAHRTGTSSLQAYLREHDVALTAQAVGFWGPRRTRVGLLDGLADRPQTPADLAAVVRGTGRLRMNLDLSRRRGVQALIISDENMLGSVRRSIAATRPYPDAGERMARLHAAFGGVTRVVLQVRALDLWWASALAYLLPRGGLLPDPAQLDRIAQATRGWRDVITDIACACPGAQIVVLPFERFAGQPAAQLAAMTGRRGFPKVPANRFWENRSADLPTLRALLAERGDDPTRLPSGPGRWMPFDARQTETLREAYADDLFWLRAGAGGLAQLTEEDGSRDAAKTAQRPDNKRGRRHDRPARILAQDG